jgi:hypothetical protein
MDDVKSQVLEILQMAMHNKFKLDQSYKCGAFTSYSRTVLQTYINSYVFKIEKVKSNSGSYGEHTLDFTLNETPLLCLNLSSDTIFTEIRRPKTFLERLFRAETEVTHTRPGSDIVGYTISELVFQLIRRVRVDNEQEEEQKKRQLIEDTLKLVRGTP